MRRTLAACAVVALLAAACSTTPTSSNPAAGPAAIRSWAQSNGLGASLATIRNDLAKVAVQLNAPSATVNGDHTICAAMLLDADQSNANLPSPDATLSSLLAKAYSVVGSAANECYAVAADHSKLARFTTLSESARSYLAEAEARAVELIGPGLLPTGTTAPVDSGV